MREPRILMRALIGALLGANLAAAVIAFAPFGVSSEGLRQQQADLGRQLAEMERLNAASARLVANVETARREGDQFLGKYVMDRRTVASAVSEELNRMAQAAGIRPLPSGEELQPIEGSDTLQMLTITAGYEGSYASLKKFVDLLDKSPRFLIVERMDVVSPQQQQAQAAQLVTVGLKVDTFVREAPGASL
jgi:type IV pilus assembly protein PilO